jgi:hypothetical protein
MAISRSDLLKELLPGLNQLFGLEYSRYSSEIPTDNHEIEVNFDGNDIQNTDNNRGV